MTESLKPPDPNSNSPGDSERTCKSAPLSETADADAASEAESGTESSGARSEHGSANDLASGRARLGRYRIRRVRGSGGFGTVYEAFDDELQRPVAVKVPNADRVDSPQRIRSFLEEARHAAALDHPSIVPVYDVGQNDGYCYVVYKLIDGCTMAERIRQQPVDPSMAATWVAEIAEALSYAHRKSVYHRDIKPSNILLDVASKPYLADFGIAVREADLAGERGRAVGTYQYMSPEQVRGEGHRIDGRSDIYSLGAVLYELLTGQRPFRGATKRELQEEIQFHEPRPPRQIRGEIPVELERICLKAMSKRVSDRYTTAQDMASELRLCVQTEKPLADSAAQSPIARAEPASDPTRTPITELPAPVVPKGIRSFSAEDSDFFLDLLPGPRDRTGLPDSIRFWKLRIEAREPETAFAVGLLYGPSGCGKSSFVKAGLIPRLAGHIVPVYVEAARDDTEARLLRVLARTCPITSARRTLPETFAALRRDDRERPAGKKVLVVIDQFEQWLHGAAEPDSSQLLQALRQCDGTHLQCLLMVRDDFWVAVTRFMRALEHRLVDGHNVAVIDLFDAAHARKVLAAIGQAYHKLPMNLSEMDKENHRFLSEAIGSLALGGKVIPVQLNLFAETLRDRPWIPATLKQLGGIEGIGVAFLDQTFHSRTANPAHRVHARAARAVLEALLPEPGSDIRGHSRSEHELMCAAGYEQRPGEFAQLLDALDTQLRFISPVDLADSDAAGIPAGPVPKRYQLTHDYLVRAVREWVTQAKRATWRGRAALCLEARTAEWVREPTARRLPSLRETILIRLGARPRSPDERRLIRVAGRHHGWRAASVLAVVLLIVSLGLLEILSLRRHRAADLVRALVAAAPLEVPYVLDRIATSRKLALAPLRAEFDDANDPSHRLRAAYGLARLGSVPHEFLVDRVADAAPGECQNLIDALEPVREQILAALIARAQEAGEITSRCRYASVLLHFGETQLASELVHASANDRTAFIHGLGQWHGDVQTLAARLHRTDDPQLAAALCVAVGMSAPQTLSNDDRRAIGSTLSHVYLNSPNGAIHSAAKWALQQFDALPAITTSRAAGWFVNEAGITMIELPSPATIQLVDERHNSEPVSREIRPRLFLSDSEISVEQFRQFLLDPEYPVDEKPVSGDIRSIRHAAWMHTLRLPHWLHAMPLVAAARSVSPTMQHPMQSVSWFDAVQFCNWLSVKSNRERCYRRTAATYIGREFLGREHVWSVWQFNPTANGYRLPTESEWEYACRAGSTTPFSFGDDESLLDFYGTIGRSHAEPCGTRIPNAFGMFEMHGNVKEWCTDWHSPAYGNSNPTGELPREHEHPYRVQRGGSFLQLPTESMSQTRFFMWPGQRSAQTGFRIACTERE